VPLEKPIVWIDLEMTGLDIEKDVILEIGVILTDSDLNREVIGPDLALTCPEEKLK
jgi:oligoribonuclease